MKTIIFTNQKGGVGKTTLTREIGLYLGTKGHRVLLVDCDGQGNLSKSLVDTDNSSGLFEALEGDDPSIRPITNTVDLLTGSVRLSLLEKRLVGELDAYERMKVLFADEAFRGYEYLLLDTPPSLGIMTINALVAATHLVVPMVPSLYSMQGTNDLMSTVSKVRRSLNPSLQILGAIINAFDSVPVITRQIRDEIRENFGTVCFTAEVPKSIRIEEAIAVRSGVVGIADKSFAKMAAAVSAVGDELITRLEATP